MTTPAWRRLARRAPAGLWAGLAGVAAALAFPPFGILPGLLGVSALLLLLDRAGGVRRAAWLGGCAGFGYFLVSLYWIAEAFLVDVAAHGWMAPFVVVLLPAFFALFWAAAGAVYASARPGGWARPAVFASAFSLVEWLRGNILTGFPWNLPGAVWPAGSAPSQWAAWIGVYGLTWLTLALAGLFAVAWDARRSRGPWATALAALVLLFGAGHLRLISADVTDAIGRTYFPDAEPGPSLRIVQSDVRQAAKYDPAAFADIVQRYVGPTGAPAAGGVTPSLVLWPEGAIPAAANDYLAPGTWTRAAIAAALRPGQTLVLGAYRIEDGPDGRARYYNSLIALRRQGADITLLGYSDKQHLVPGGEYLPFDDLLARLGVKQLVQVGEGFTPGPDPRPLPLVGVPTMQPLICYEGLFPALVRRAVAKGERPRWLVNLSNDAWFGATSGPWQHLNLASYRAIETGLPMVRATPTGVSAVVDGFGRTAPGARLGLRRAGVIDARLPPALAATPYQRFGEGPFWALLLAGLALAAGSRLRHNRRDPAETKIGVEERG